MNKTRTRVILAAVAGLSLIFAVVGVFGGMFSSVSRPELTNMNIRRTIEVAPAGADECWRWTFHSPLGGVIGARPQQCNGDQGELVYWPHTDRLKRQVLFFKDSGRQRFVADYAADGRQVIRGFALRDDGTKLWEASPDGNGVITTITYYWNGEIFSVERRRLDDRVADRMYYRHGSVRWLHMVANYDVTFEQVRTTPYAQLTEAQLYDETGRLTVDLRPNPADRGQSQYTFFRADGTREFVQTWAMEYYGGDGPGEGGGSSSFSPKRVVMYAADGNTVVREFGLSMHAVNEIVDPQPDGGQLVSTVTGLNITHVKRTAADGTVLEDRAFDAQHARRIDDLDFRFVRLPDAANPHALWASEEQAHYRHTVVQ